MFVMFKFVTEIIPFFYESEVARQFLFYVQCEQQKELISRCVKEARFLYLVDVKRLKDRLSK